MKYQIKLNGMHCQGCGNLIKLTLEDEGFKEVTVSLEKETGDFETDSDKTEAVKAKLDEAFTGLSGYSYDHLQQK